MSTFSNLRKRIYYWHLLVAVIVVKYFVLSAIHLHQYLYISQPTVPANLAKHLTQALWNSNRADLTSSLTEVIVTTFFSSASHLILIGFNLLTFCWSWFNTRFFPNMAVLRAVLFFAVFKSLGRIAEYFWERSAGYVVNFGMSDLLDDILRAMIFGFCCKYYQDKRRVWTIFGLCMAGYLAYDFFDAFFYYPVFKIPSKLTKITPIFDKVKKLAAQVGFPLDNIYLDTVYRDHRDNLSVMGVGQLAVMMLGDKAVKTLSLSGTVAVVAHELGHWHYNHIVYEYLLTSIYMVARSALTVYVTMNPAFYKAFDVEVDLSSPALPFGIGLIIADILADEISELGMPLYNMISWFKEYQADEFAHKLGLSRALYNGLTKWLSKESDAVCTLPYGIMYSSHPIFSRRMENISRLFKS